MRVAEKKENNPEAKVSGVFKCLVIKTKNMSRQTDNFEILKKLNVYFTKHPDQRFIQGLFNLKIVEQIVIRDKPLTFGFKDTYHEEPNVTLNKIKNQEDLLH